MLVQAYSYWTISDIFEENYFPSLPFHGGFGLLNLYGIAKPAYRGFELLHALGSEMVPVEGSHATVDAWVIRGVASATVLLTNFALPRHPIATEMIRISLAGARRPAEASIRRIDADHANAKRCWQEMGCPGYLSKADVAELDAASQCKPEPLPFDFRDGTLCIDVSLPALAVAAITFRFAAQASG